MKLKKLILTLVLSLLGVLFISGTQIYAATKKIVLEPSTTKDTYEYVYVSVTSPIKAENVAKLEVLAKKVTKTSDKKWKKAESIYFYANDDDTTIGYFYAGSNGTYSVRLTTNTGKKYVMTIKINNLLPSSENSAKEATITGISGPDKDGNYTITVDYETAYSKTSKELKGKKIGDKLDFNGKKATITAMYSLDDNYELKSISAFDNNCYAVICQTDNWKEFYDENSEEYRSDPSNQLFGLISYDGKIFYAYDDYEYAPDCYVTLGYTYPSQVELKLNKDTIVKPAYIDREKNPNGCEITADLYVSMIGNQELQEEYGIYIFDGTVFRIYEKYDKKIKKHTDIVDVLAEVYYP